MYSVLCSPSSDMYSTDLSTLPVFRQISRHSWFMPLPPNVLSLFNSTVNLQIHEVMPKSWTYKDTTTLPWSPYNCVWKVGNLPNFYDTQIDRSDSVNLWYLAHLRVSFNLFMVAAVGLKRSTYCLSVWIQIHYTVHIVYNNPGRKELWKFCPCIALEACIPLCQGIGFTREWQLLIQPSLINKIKTGTKHKWWNFSSSYRGFSLLIKANFT